MPNYTANYNLEKPLGSEYYNVGVFNENADKIDAALKAASESGSNVFFGWDNQNDNYDTPIRNITFSEADLEKLSAGIPDNSLFIIKFDGYWSPDINTTESSTTNPYSGDELGFSFGGSTYTLNVDYEDSSNNKNGLLYIQKHAVAMFVYTSSRYDRPQFAYIGSSSNSIRHLTKLSIAGTSQLSNHDAPIGFYMDHRTDGGHNIQGEYTYISTDLTYNPYTKTFNVENMQIDGNVDIVGVLKVNSNVDLNWENIIHGGNAAFTSITVSTAINTPLIKTATITSPTGDDETDLTIRATGELKLIGGASGLYLSPGDNTYITVNGQLAMEEYDILNAGLVETRSISGLEETGDFENVPHVKMLNALAMRAYPSKEDDQAIDSYDDFPNWAKGENSILRYTYYSNSDSPSSSAAYYPERQRLVLELGSIKNTDTHSGEFIFNISELMYSAGYAHIFRVSNYMIDTVQSTSRFIFTSDIDAESDFTILSLEENDPDLSKTLVEITTGREARFNIPSDKFYMRDNFWSQNDDDDDENLYRRTTLTSVRDIFEKKQVITIARADSLFAKNADYIFSDSDSIFYYIDENGDRKIDTTVKVYHDLNDIFYSIQFNIFNTNNRNSKTKIILYPGHYATESSIYIYTSNLEITGYTSNNTIISNNNDLPIFIVQPMWYFDFKLKSPVGSENPKSEKWFNYNINEEMYVLTNDTSVISSKNYYTLSAKMVRLPKGIEIRKIQLERGNTSSNSGSMIRLKKPYEFKGYADLESAVNLYSEVPEYILYDSNLVYIEPNDIVNYNGSYYIAAKSYNTKSYIWVQYSSTIFNINNLIGYTSLNLDYNISDVRFLFSESGDELYLYDDASAIYSNGGYNIKIQNCYFDNQSTRKSPNKNYDNVVVIKSQLPLEGHFFVNNFMNIAEYHSPSSSSFDFYPNYGVKMEYNLPPDDISGNPKGNTIIGNIGFDISEVDTDYELE